MKIDFRYLFVLFLFPLVGLKAQNTSTCRIYFATNISVPSDEEQSKLKKFIAIPDSMYVTAIELNGYSDDIGKNAYNDSLASRRAEEIKKILLSSSIYPELITKTLSKGEIEIKKNDKDAEKKRAENRRVDVIMKYAVKVKKAVVIEKVIVPELISPVKIDSVALSKVAFVPNLIPDSVQVGDNYRLENIYFEGDRSTLLASSNNTLEKLLKILQDKQKLYILILGHVCCLPAGEDAPDKNTGKKNLSVGRAKAIYDYLIAKGINPKRLTFKGMKANMKTGKGAAYDRRVEIEIIKK